MSTDDPSHIQLGIGMGRFDTTIEFDNDLDVDAEMTSASLSGGWLVNDRWTLRVAAGIITDGTLKTDGLFSHDVTGGGTGSLGAEYRAQSGEGGTPFVDVSLFLSGSWAKTQAPGSDTETDYSAMDARLGARTTWNIDNRFFPFAAARVFGGPVNWEIAGEDVTGSDAHHYQVALGAAYQFGRFGLYVEWAGLGEKALSAGINSTW